MGNHGGARSSHVRQGNLMVSPEAAPPEGWDEYRKLVLHELKRLADGQEAMREEVASLKSDLAAQRVRAGLWGAVAGAIPGGVAAFVWWVTHIGERK